MNGTDALISYLSIISHMKDVRFSGNFPSEIFCIHKCWFVSQSAKQKAFIFWR